MLHVCAASHKTLAKDATVTISSDLCLFLFHFFKIWQWMTAALLVVDSSGTAVVLAAAIEMYVAGSTQHSRTSI